MVTVGIFPFEENSHGRAGNRTRDHMISNQRLRPLGHEAGQGFKSRDLMISSQRLRPLDHEAGQGLRAGTTWLVVRDSDH